MLCAVTVFITTYALILPAITMEPSPGIRLDHQFTYETDQLLMRFDVRGRANFQNRSDERSDADPDKVRLTVSALEEESSVYSEYVRYAQENIGDEDLLQLLTLRVLFHHEDAPLDMRNCQVNVTIALKDTTLAQQNPMARMARATGTYSLTGNTGAGEDEVVAMTAYQGVSKDLSNQDTAYQGQNGDGVALRTTLRGNTMAVALYSAVNPTFTVQYYSHFTVFDNSSEALSGYISIDVIDTSGGKLPQNGVTPNLKDVYLKKDGNANRYVLATHKVLSPLYQERTFQYVQAPSVMYMDRLRSDANYHLSEVWVLKDGKSPASTNRNDWNVYPDTVSFTNRAESATDNRIYITEGMVIRFIYDENSGSFTSNADFFDYDISDGDIHNANGRTYPTSSQNNGTWYQETYMKGINSFQATSGTVKFAFGNVNTNSGYGDVMWNNQSLNKYNTKNYDGCTFGLVVGINEDGTPKFAPGISAPKLFGSAQATGKTQITDKSLQFIRVGDTYVLTAVNNTTTKDLQYFNNPTYVDASGNTILHSHIFTNNFWPMDSAWTYGANGHDMIFGDAKLLENRRLIRTVGDTSTSKALPVGDDGKDHNSYFGMHYEISFTLSEDYLGPLEYMFYGDDDMWVFLDGKLVCDIGGVHSSVGQYVNLWDYLEKGSSGEHTLTFFYTERGASGSTCYMQFTLPSVDTDAPQIETNTLTLGKQLQNSNTDMEFQFTVELKDENGNDLVDDYSYTRYDGEGNVIENGILNSTQKVVFLRGGEKITVDYLPEGTKFTITEEKLNGFYTIHNINGGANTESNTAAGEINSDVNVLFINSTSVILPSTGGEGVLLFFIPLGVAITYLLAMPLLDKLYEKHKKRNNKN